MTRIAIVHFKSHRYITMKKIFLLLVVILPYLGKAQPAGYYLTANGLNGEPLRIALKSIIRPHTALSYSPGLWNAYHTTDVKPSGKVWDVYSDIPGGTPAYEYTIGTNQCSGSSPSAENGCYNREHTWPQSKFSSSAPMQTDLFIVYPADYYVNSHRGDLPYGVVATASQTFTNGSKIGINTYAGAPASECFEPIDSFKGDLARNYFYVSTCYRDDSATFSSWEMATHVNLNPWVVQMLLEWHHNDPVSKKEIDRNNAVYALQGNRNPFIDHPEYADCIWGSGGCGTNNKVPDQSSLATVSLFPNPVSDKINIVLPVVAPSFPLSLRIFNLNGIEVYHLEAENLSGQNLSISVSGWSKGMYFLQVIMDKKIITQKVLVN